MSIRENEALVRRYFEAYRTGNVDDAADYIATDAVFSAPDLDEDGSYGDVRGTSGPEGFQEQVRGTRTAFPDLIATIIDLVVTEDKVVLRYRSQGTFRGPYGSLQPTGKQFESTGVELIHIADGKISSVWSVGDEMRAWQQLGVLPKLLAP